MATNRKRGGNTKPDPLVEIAELAGGLSLTALRDNIPMLLKKAEAETLSYSDFALQMLQLEFIARNNRRLTRNNRRLTRNLKRSGLPTIIEGLDTYDFSVRPKLEAPLVRELENCRFAEEDGRNIICVGRPGLGKSRILDAIARAACDKGYSVKKVMTADLLEELHASLVDGVCLQFTDMPMNDRYSLSAKIEQDKEVILLDNINYKNLSNESSKQQKDQVQPTPSKNG